MYTKTYIPQQAIRNKISWYCQRLDIRHGADMEKLLVVFYGISNIVVHSMPNPLHTYI